MKIATTLFFAFLVCTTLLYSQQIYKTEALSSDIHTIQINKNGNWDDYPIVNLNSGEFIRLNFDRLGENSFNRLRYKLIPCNADWTLSSLSDIEFINGFNDNLIEDYASSVNTTVGYTNFMLNIPNQDMSIKLAGNYIVEVYEEDNPQNILLHAAFSVVDSRISLTADVSSQTMVDSNRAHHQLSFTINHANLNVQNPLEDLYIVVRQNNRLDNERCNMKPTFVQANRLVYQQKRELIFEAGNEYRRFDTPSHRYNGLRIWQIRFDDPYYSASIIPDKILSGLRYVYDEDQNGRFYIRNAEGNDNDTEADYFYMNFTLIAENPFIENVYINGNFTNNTFDDKYLMQYDYASKMYRTTIPLKQGGYNYQYLTDKGNGIYSTADIEGNYYETENEYQIYVYHRPPGRRSDALVGFLNIGKRQY